MFAFSPESRESSGVMNHMGGYLRTKWTTGLPRRGRAVDPGSAASGKYPQAGLTSKPRGTR